MAYTGQGLWIDNGAGPIQNPALSQADFNTGLALWQAANGKQFYQNGLALIATFVDSFAATIIAIGVGQGDTNALAVIKWMHAIYSYYTTNLSTVTGWTLPSQIVQNTMNYTTVGSCPIGLGALATSVVTTLSTKYPGQV